MILLCTGSGLTWKKARFALFWLLCLSRVPAAWGQQQIMGTVVDTVAAPLPGVTVFLTRPGSAAGLVYSITDETGHFSLIAPPNDTLLLHTRLMGYSPTVSWWVRARPQVLRITLRTSPTQLGQVVVRAPARISQYNDTTTYQARDFRTAEQRTLQDVLRRIPGFEVADNGSIRYQGREISGIYVEGDNLTGADYRRLSRALDASLVEKIQPIQRFVENPLLGGLVHSETTVLNITLPADHKKPLFGSVNAQAALPHYREANLNLFGLQGRHRLFGLATHNNVGLTQNPETHVPLLSISENPLLQELLPSPQLLVPQSLVNTSFRPELATLNLETTAGLVHVLRSARPGRWKMLNDLAAYSDTRHQQLQAETRLLLPANESLSFHERTAARQLHQWVRLRQNWFVTLGPRTNFTYEHRLRRTNLRATDEVDLLTVAPASLLQEALRQQLRNSSWQLSQNALFTKRFSEQAAWQTQLGHFLDQVPQHLFLTSTRPERVSALVPGADSAATYLQQQLPTRQHGLFLLTEYFRTGQQLNIVPMLEMRYIRTWLQPHLAVNGAEMPKINFYASQLLGAAKLRFHRQLGQLTLAGLVGGRAGRLRAENQAGLPYHPLFYPLASLSVELPQKPYAVWRATYGYDQILPLPQELLTTPLITDYRTSQQGLASWLVRPEHRAGLQFTHFNSARLTQLQAGVNGSWQRASLAQAQQADNLSGNVWLLPGTAVSSASATLQAAQLLDSLALRVQMESSLTYLEFMAQRANDTLRRNKLLTSRYRLQVGTATRSPVNFFAGATLMRTTLRQPTDQPSRNTQVQLDAQLLVRTQRLVCTVRADQLRLRHNHYLIVGAEASYIPTSNSSWAFTLSLRNLLNTQAFDQVTIAPLVYARTSYRMLPRLIMPGATYRF